MFVAVVVVRCYLVGLCGIGEGVSDLGVVFCLVCVYVWVCVRPFIVGVSFKVGVWGFEYRCGSHMVGV